MWINPNNGTIFRLHHEIRFAFRGISMPYRLEDSVILSLGLLPVTQVSKPAGYIVEEASPTLVDGVWTQQWITRTPTAEETAAKSGEVRTARNQLLTDTDWTQTLDAPVNREAWSIYRQQLRDLSGQTDFPWEVNWPIQPS